MCLCIDKEATANMVKRLAKAPITFYKVYRLNGDGVIESPYQCKAVRVIDGCIRSGRRSPKLTNFEIEYSSIDDGIHVCCHKKSAQNIIDSNDGDFMVPVTGKAEDFIAAGTQGYDDAVFTKVYVDAQLLKDLAKKQWGTKDK